MQELNQIAFDTLLQDLVLPPRQSVEQIVRLDYSGLSDVLTPHPSLSFQVTFWTMTNPRSYPAQEGQVAVMPGPIGQRVQFQRLIERVAAPLTDPDQRVWKQVIDDLQGTQPLVKLDRIDLLVAYIDAVNRSEDQSPEGSRFTADLLMQINRRRDDETPIVADWATYAAATVATGDERAELLRQMRTDGNWIRKLLSLTVANDDPKLAGEVAARLTGDDQPPLVRRFAQATLAAIEQEKAVGNGDGGDGGAAGK